VIEGARDRVGDDDPTRILVREEPRRRDTGARTADERGRPGDDDDHTERDPAPPPTPAPKAPRVAPSPRYKLGANDRSADRSDRIDARTGKNDKSSRVPVREPGDDARSGKAARVDLEDVAAASGGGRGWLIAVLLLLILGGGGFATWWFAFR